MFFSPNKYINEKTKDLITPDALDLLYKMLEVDHSSRITAKEALEHPYFKNFAHNKNDKKKEINPKKSRSKN